MQFLPNASGAKNLSVAENKRALALELPINIREIVQHQYAAVLATHDRVKALRDAK